MRLKGHGLVCKNHIRTRMESPWMILRMSAGCSSILVHRMGFLPLRLVSVNSRRSHLRTRTDSRSSILSFRLVGRYISPSILGDLVLCILRSSRAIRQRRVYRETDSNLETWQIMKGYKVKEK